MIGKASDRSFGSGWSGSTRVDYEPARQHRFLGEMNQAGSQTTGIHSTVVSEQTNRPPPDGRDRVFKQLESRFVAQASAGVEVSKGHARRDGGVAVEFGEKHVVSSDSARVFAVEKNLAGFAGKKVDS